MIRGFKEFLLRGNVLDLAVGIAIGVAFTTLVDAFGEYLVNPIIALVGGNNINGFAWTMISGNPKTTIDFGALVNAGIVFIVTMAVLYFVVVAPVSKIQERRRRGEVEPEEEPEDVVLLREIRDALRERT